MEATARHVLDQRSVAQELKGNANTAFRSLLPAVAGKGCQPSHLRALPFQTVASTDYPAVASPLRSGCGAILVCIVQVKAVRVTA
jgi:hypothetical protein